MDCVTTGSPERLFSMARRIKTWLWWSIKQRKFTASVILSQHESLVDKLPLVKVAGDFVDIRPNHRSDVRVFTEEDLK